MKERFAGIDWASEEYAVCVVDEGGMSRRERAVAHDELGIAAFCSELVALGAERLAIERPDGILVDRLLEAGLTVIAVHPNQAKAARERHSVPHGKSGRFDAFVLAELARTEAHRLRVLRPDSDKARAFRALTRTREDRSAATARLADELRTRRGSPRPGGTTIAADPDLKVGVASLKCYPLPTDARELVPSRLDGPLACHAHCGRYSAREMLDWLRSALQIRVDAPEPRWTAVLGLCAALPPIVYQIRERTLQVAGTIRTRPVGIAYGPAKHTNLRCLQAGGD